MWNAEHVARKPQANASLAGGVYVVDDDKGFLRSMDRLLRTAGFLRGHVHVGAGVPRRGPERGPACLLLDLRMPVVSGIDLQERLAASERTSPSSS